MKLCIKDNSLRLRVSRSEVASLLKRDRLEETIHFAPQANAKLTYALERSASMNALAIQYTENNVTVSIPAEQAPGALAIRLVLSTASVLAATAFSMC
jgi:hypothetical protein